MAVQKVKMLKVPGGNADGYEIEPASHTHSDNYNLLNEDTYKSFSDLMIVCPNDLNGYTISNLDIPLAMYKSYFNIHNGKICK